MTVKKKDTRSLIDTKNLEYSRNHLNRDREYVKLLQHYVNNQRRTDISQLILKIFFFLIVCSTYVITIYFGGQTILNVSKKENISLADLGAALTGLASILSVIIILPSKIAEHLFPSGGDQSSTDFIQSMQSYDLSKSSSQKYLSDESDLVIQVPESTKNGLATPNPDSSSD